MLALRAGVRCAGFPRRYEHHKRSKLLPMSKTILLLVALLFGPFVDAVETLSDYKLGAGDQIRITVYDEPDLSIEVRLSDAGTISYPFLGEIRVAGRTVGELEQRLRDGLKGDYLVEPDISVSILEYRQFYIHGEVESPGGFAYVPGITLRKAIAVAGGFTERASRRKINVIREPNSNPRVISLDEEVRPGDIITIEQSFF